jgi:LuxR family maltose regulon positive regulatory protein
MTRIPFVADGLLQVAAAREAAGVVVGSPAWFAWLADDSARSFSFRSSAGITQRARSAGSAAARTGWHTVRLRVRQYKKYLGTAADLTPERLADAAAVLS